MNIKDISESVSTAETLWLERRGRIQNHFLGIFLRDLGASNVDICTTSRRTRGVHTDVPRYDCADQAAGHMPIDKEEIADGVVHMTEAHVADIDTAEPVVIAAENIHVFDFEVRKRNSAGLAARSSTAERIDRARL